MRRKILVKIFSCIAIVIFSQLSFATDYLTYQVKKGDWAAKILRSIGYCPLWGPKGSISAFKKDMGNLSKKKVILSDLEIFSSFLQKN